MFYDPQKISVFFPAIYWFYLSWKISSISLSFLFVFHNFHSFLCCFNIQRTQTTQLSYSRNDIKLSYFYRFILIFHTLLCCARVKGSFFFFKSLEKFHFTTAAMSLTAFSLSYTNWEFWNLDMTSTWPEREENFLFLINFSLFTWSWLWARCSQRCKLGNSRRCFWSRQSTVNRWRRWNEEIHEMFSISLQLICLCFVSQWMCLHNVTEHHFNDFNV